jgi:hypothetical protein
MRFKFTMENLLKNLRLEKKWWAINLANSLELENIQNIRKRKKNKLQWDKKYIQ